MSQRVYTKPVQIAMFEQVTALLGPWNHRWNGGKPDTVSTQQFEAACEKIRIVLAKKFGAAAPKTARSIAMAIYFTLEVQGTKSQQPQFRSSAYEAGFLTYLNILALECRRVEIDPSTFIESLLPA